MDLLPTMQDPALRARVAAAVGAIHGEPGAIRNADGAVLRSTAATTSAAGRNATGRTGPETHGAGDG